jgi:hypothetical protein
VLGKARASCANDDHGCRLIPVQFHHFPARFKKFPVLLLRESDRKRLKFRVDWVASSAELRPRLRISLLISLLAGNFDAETSSNRNCLVSHAVVSNFMNLKTREARSVSGTAGAQRPTILTPRNLTIAMLSVGLIKPQPEPGVSSR